MGQVTAAQAAAVKAAMGPSGALNSYQYGQVGTYAFYRIGHDLPPIGTVVAPGRAYWFVPETQMDRDSALGRGAALFTLPLDLAAMPAGRVRTGYLFDFNPFLGGYTPSSTAPAPTPVDMSTLNNGGYDFSTVSVGLPNGAVFTLRSKRTGRVYWYVPPKFGAGGGGIATVRTTYALEHGGVPFTVSYPISHRQESGYLFNYNPKAWAVAGTAGVAYQPGVGGKAKTMEAVIGVGTAILAVAGGVALGGALAAAGAVAAAPAVDGGIVLADTLGTSALDTAGFGLEFLGPGADAITGAGVSGFTAFGDIAVTNAALAAGGVAVDVGYAAPAYPQPAALGVSDLVPKPTDLVPKPTPPETPWWQTAAKIGGTASSAVTAISKVHAAVAPTKKPTLAPGTTTPQYLDADGHLVEVSADGVAAGGSSIGNFALIALGLVGVLALA